MIRSHAVLFAVGFVIGVCIVIVSAFIHYYRESPYRYDLQG